MSPPGTRSPEPGAARALLVYNALRLALLAGCVGLGYVAGLRGFALLLAALLVSGLLSWFLLAPQRIRAAMAVEHAVETPAGAKVVSPARRFRDRLRAKQAAEDAYAEEVQRRQAEERAAAQTTGAATDASR